MNASEAQAKQRRIEDLALKEVDMIYSLARVGEWKDVDIGRRYGISQVDVRKVIGNYVDLRGAVQENQHHERLPQEPSLELTTKERKRRSDARFVTPADRQAAYRARLKEKRHPSVEHPLPANETDMPIPAAQELSVTVYETPVPEIGPENAETQHSACDNSPVECHDISENV